MIVLYLGLMTANNRQSCSSPSVATWVKFTDILLPYCFLACASKPAMSNPRPGGPVWPSRRFCAAQFRFSL